MLRAAVLAALLAAAPARAIVGGAPADAAMAGSAAMLISDRGSFCSAAVLAPRLLLTAAHCVAPGAHYRLLRLDAAGQPVIEPPAGIAIHPRYDPQAYARRRFVIDLALVGLASPLPGAVALRLPAAAEPGIAGAAYRIAGFGLASADPHTGGTLRQAVLVGAGPVSKVQLRLAGPAGTPMGSCNGDSGGPVVRQADGVLVGVLASSVGCGGRTGVALLGTALDWLHSAARSLGTPLP